MKQKTLSIVMTRQMFDKIRKEQAKEAPNEICFMLNGNLSRSSHHFRFVTTESHFPLPEEYARKEVAACRPTAKWFQDGLLHSAEEQMHTVDCHAHTFDKSDSPHESHMDHIAAEKMYPTMTETFPGMAILSMVISHDFKGAEAHIYRPALQCRTPIDKIMIIGPGQMEIIYPTSSPLRAKTTSTTHKTDTSRLALAFGREAIENNRNIRIGALGCGSLGEPIVVQLVNLGFPVTILDMDDFNEENANRSLFGNQITATRNLTKTELCRRAVLQTNPEADVRVIHGDLRDEEIQRQLTDCDLLVISTDNQTSRFVANHLALVHGMVLFDAATAISVKDGELSAVFGQIIKVVPGSNLCHECSDFFDATEAYQGLLSEEDYALARERGYVGGDEMPAPSVMPLNMAMAGLTVWEILRYVTGATPEEKWDILTVDLLNPAMQPHYYERDANGNRFNCPLCSSSGMLFGGDAVPLLTRQKGYTHSKAIELMRSESWPSQSQTIPEEIPTEESEKIDDSPTFHHCQTREPDQILVTGKSGFIGNTISIGYKICLWMRRIFRRGP
ncbi:MAG: ThiF family adenylyltransferase [Kiritimatiellales bacterium]